MIELSNYLPPHNKTKQNIDKFSNILKKKVLKAALQQIFKVLQAYKVKDKDQ